MTTTNRTRNRVSLPSSVVLSALEFDVLWAGQRFPAPARRTRRAQPRRDALRTRQTGGAGLGRPRRTRPGQRDQSRQRTRRPARHPGQPEAGRRHLGVDRQGDQGAGRVERQQRAARGGGRRPGLADPGPADLVRAVRGVGRGRVPGGRRPFGEPAAGDVARGRAATSAATPPRSSPRSAGAASPCPTPRNWPAMFANIEARGQFGAATHPARRPHPARPTGWSPSTTPTGAATSTWPAPRAAGTPWVTVTPANNARIVENVAELLDEL